MTEPAPTDSAPSDKITISDVVKALFLHEQDVSPAHPHVTSGAFGSEGLHAAADSKLDLVTDDAILTIDYELTPLTIVAQPNVRRTLISGLGIVLTVGAAYSAQSLMASQQNAVLGGAVYAVAALMWLALLAFELAPPDGGLLKRGPRAVLTASNDTEGSQDKDATSNLIRSFITLSGLGLTLAAYILNGNNLFTLGGVICWLLSIVVWGISLVERAPAQLFTESLTWLKNRRLKAQRPSPSRWVALSAFVVILAAASFFRFYELNVIPGEMTSDHVEKLLDAYDVSQGNFHVFFPRNGGREAIQMYLVALTGSLTGTGMTHLTLKLVSAFEALLLIPIIILMGRELIDWETGFFAAALVAISWWDTSLGRLGLRIVLTPLIMTLVLIMFTRGIRTGSRKWWLWAGIWMGVGVYSYQALRMTPVVGFAAWLVAIVPSVVSYLTMRRRQNADAQVIMSRAESRIVRQTLNFACSALMAVVIFVPMLRFWSEDSASLWNRVVNRTTSNEVAIQGSPADILADNYAKALGMFNVKGDVAWISGLPNAPALDVISGGLLVLGLVAWAVRLRVRRDPVDYFIIVAGLIMLLPSALALAFPIENPSFTRASGTLPIVFILCAWPLTLIRQRWTEIMGSRAGVALASSLITILLVASAFFNFRTYFVDFSASYRLSALNPSQVAAAVRQIVGKDAPLDGVWLIGWPFWHDYRAIGLNMGDPTFDGAILDNSALQAILDSSPDAFETRPLVFVVHQDDVESRRILSEKFPKSDTRLYVGISPKHNFYLIVVPSD